MKSKDATTVTQVALALLSDAQAAYPRARGFSRDSSRITLCVKDRGLAFFTLTLPSCDEALLSGLESGVLPRSWPLSRRRSKKDRRPRFLWDLWSLVFDSSGVLVQEPDTSAIAFLRQIFCLGKKLAVSCSPDRLASALKDYHDIENRMAPPVNDWSSDDPDWVHCSFERSFPIPTPDLYYQYKPEYSRIQRLLRRLDFVSRVLVSELGPFDPLGGSGTVLDRYQHGPGAVADQTGSQYKFDIPSWPMKLEYVFPFDWCGSPSLEGTPPSRTETPSNLIAVPKTAKAPRLIASEPVAHQWTQQWVKNELVERFKSCRVGNFLNTLDQSLSRALVGKASTDRSLSTLDLSSASDRVSCRHIEALLDANQDLLRVAHATRTRWVRDSISKPPIFVKTKKFAAMGSALTFPIESLFFLAVCLASCDAATKEDIDRLVGQVRVFGDDLIIPTVRYDDLVLLLTHLGLKVNLSKSFSRGYFRESCGLDAYKGDNVTPCKPKVLWCHGPVDFQSLVDTSNNLHAAGFWNAAQVVASTATFKGFRPQVVPMSAGLPGLLSFASTTDHLKSRWNVSLQRVEYRVSSLVSKGKIHRQDKSSALLQFFTASYSVERPRSLGRTSNLSANLAYRWRAPSYLSRAP